MPTTKITTEQAQAAIALRNDVHDYAALIALIPLIPAEVKAMLAEAHERVGFGCSARGEGLSCCIDVLLDDPAGYAPEKVAAAGELLQRWNEQLG